MSLESKKWQLTGNVYLPTLPNAKSPEPDDQLAARYIDSPKISVYSISPAPVRNEDGTLTNYLDVIVRMWYMQGVNERERFVEHRINVAEVLPYIPYPATTETALDVFLVAMSLIDHLAEDWYSGYGPVVV